MNKSVDYEAQKVQRLQQKITQDIQELHQKSQTMQIASLDPEGKPHASYAPYVVDGGKYFILISDIARHAQNLALNPDVAFMIIEDEADSREAFARRRLSFDAKATEMSRESQTWENIIPQLQARFGDIIGNLTQLQDFHLFCLTPISGRFVKGFGQAYQISPTQLGEAQVGTVHLKQGHIRRDDGRELTLDNIELDPSSIKN